MTKEQLRSTAKDGLVALDRLMSALQGERFKGIQREDLTIDVVHLYDVVGRLTQAAEKGVE